MIKHYIKIRLGTYPRVLGLEKDTGCKDPQHQRARGVNTYYPPGTVCYKEPSQGMYLTYCMLLKARNFKTAIDLSDIHRGVRFSISVLHIRAK